MESDITVLEFLSVTSTNALRVGRNALCCEMNSSLWWGNVKTRHSDGSGSPG